MGLKEINNKMEYKNGICISSPKLTPRTLITHSNSKKWKGCIYFSAFDLTGQTLLFLKDISGDYTGEFLNYPIFVFTSIDKTDVETLMSDKLQSLFKTK